MNRSLEPLLRASLDAETPEWLDRLVVERVVASVKSEAPAAGMVTRRPREGAVTRALRVWRRISSPAWSRAVQRIEGWLIERLTRTRASVVARLR